MVALLVLCGGARAGSFTVSFSGGGATVQSATGSWAEPYKTLYNQDNTNQVIGTGGAFPNGSNPGDSGATWVTGSGAITATATWNGSADDELCPTQVIVVQFGDVWSYYSFTGQDVVCDDGLGDARLTAIRRACGRSAGTYRS